MQNHAAAVGNGLQAIGYSGAPDSVRRFARRWKSKNQSPKLSDAFVPLLFLPGDACQFDWSQEEVELGGVMQKIKVAHFRMAYSRQMFVVAYPREIQEMVLDAHARAFGGVPARLIYDNLKAVVDTVYAGKERQFNRRFLTMANHYLFEAVACTPASGWEKGQVCSMMFDKDIKKLPANNTDRMLSNQRCRLSNDEFTFI